MLLWLMTINLWKFLNQNKMKKITIFLLFMSYAVFAQTYSTGTMTFFTGFTGKIDVTSTTVTVTLVGPSTSWLSVGFDATTMNDNGRDLIVFDGTSITDRSFNGIGITPPTDTQNWTLSSNTVNTGVRTVVMTRARVATEGTDYTFPFSAQALNVIFARSIGTNTFGYHGGGNCGTISSNLTLGTGDFDKNSLKIYPNPSKDFLSVEFPNLVEKGEVKIYDSLGKVVVKKDVTLLDNKIETSFLKTGTYTVVLRTEYGNATQTLLIE